MQNKAGSIEADRNPGGWQEEGLTTWTTFLFTWYVIFFLESQTDGALVKGEKTRGNNYANKGGWMETENFFFLVRWELSWE